MFNRYGLIFLILVIAAIAAVVVLAGSLSAGLAYRDNMAAAAAGTITGILAVTLFVERGLAAINAIVFGAPQRAAEIQLTTGAATGIEALSDVLQMKERVRLLGAFVVGLFISAAVVRTLEGLLQTTGRNVPLNGLFFPVDVVLTAALIAGGSNGLAFLTQVVRDRLAPPAVVSGVAAAAVGAASDVGADKAIRARLTTGG